jgi:predicted RND superfamily exporter protein
MLSTTGKACFFTTVTTMGGFAALLSAELESVGSFGLSVAIGIFVAWLTNQVLLPWLLRRVDAGRGFPGGVVNRYADKVINLSIHHSIGHPRSVVVAGLLFAVACSFMIPKVDIDQYFNESYRLPIQLAAPRRCLNATSVDSLDPRSAFVGRTVAR